MNIRSTVPIGVLVLALGIVVGGCGIDEALESVRKEDAPSRFRSAEASLAKAENRFFSLDIAAMAAFEVGEVEKARSYARELLDLAPKYVRNWNYGNAIHYGHVVLGRVALSAGDVSLAKQELLAAGATPGSPQLNSFGPNMTLARDLLMRGERETVLQYLRECGRFWKTGRGRLRIWSIQVRLHISPSFGLNL
jgi:hypothetical protein